MNPFLVKDIIPGSQSSNPTLLGKVDGSLLFTTSESSGMNTKLWKTDGTQSGTVVLEDFGNQSFPPLATTSSVNGNLFFLLSTGFRSVDLYKSDGTPEGTFSIDSYDPATPLRISNPINVDGTLFATFSDRSDFFQGKLIKYDNTTFEQVLVQDNILASGGGSPTNLTSVNSTLYFSALDSFFDENGGAGPQDRELWKSDGTNAGTVEVKDINPGDDSSNPENLTDVNGTLYFTADDGTNGRELWKSDGTEDGTVLVKDIVSGSTGSDPNNLTDVNSKLFFTANDGSNGTELWKSDGTQGGTSLVKDIISGSGSSNPDKLTDVNGTIFFTANNGSDGVELWKSDGTDAGTVLVKDIRPGSEGSSLDNLTNVDGTLYFTADNGTNGTELWKSDGTAQGTVLVGDIRPGSEGSNPGQLVNVDGTLYFSADNGVNGTEVWAVDTKDKDPNDVTFSVSDNSPGDFNNVPGLPKQVTIVPGETGDIELPQNFSSDLFESIVAIDGADGTGGPSVGGPDFPAGSAVLRDANRGRDNQWNFSKVDLKNIAYINGRGGRDRIIGSQNADNIFGGTGDDVIRGQAGNDLLLGETKGHPTVNDNDILIGGADDDILDGQNGDDLLIGGAGKDKFVLSGDFDRDTINDFVLGQDEIVNTSDRSIKDVVLGSDAFNVSFNNSIDILTVNVNGNDQGELQSYLSNLGSNEAPVY